MFSAYVYSLHLVKFNSLLHWCLQGLDFRLELATSGGGKGASHKILETIADLSSLKGRLISIK